MRQEHFYKYAQPRETEVLVGIREFVAFEYL